MIEKKWELWFFFIVCLVAMFGCVKVPEPHSINAPPANMRKYQHAAGVNSPEKLSEKASNVQGLSKGSSLVITRWNNLGRQCDNISKLSGSTNAAISRLNQDIKLRKYGNVGRDAFTKGYKEGVKKELAIVNDSCMDEQLEKWRKYLAYSLAGQSGKTSGSRFAQKIRDQGKSVGASTVITVWDNLERQCNNIPKLVSILDNAVKRLGQNVKQGKYKTGGEGKTFVSGYMNGLEREFTGISSSCSKRDY